jgi:hypothetical protein
MSDKNEIIDGPSQALLPPTPPGEEDLDYLVGDEDSEINCEQAAEGGDYKKDSCAPFLNEAIRRLEEENEQLTELVQECKDAIRGLRMVLADKKVEIARTESVLMGMCIVTIISGLMTFGAYLW